MNTIKEVLGTLEYVATKHKLVNEVTNGDPSTIQNTERLFPLVHLVPVTTDLKVNENSMSAFFSFQMYVMDLRLEDNSIDIQVLSNMFEIGNSIISKHIYDYEDQYNIDAQTIKCEPFTTKTDHNCAGWIFTFKVSVDQSSCENNLMFD
jgi:hypothetical protein